MVIKMKNNSEKKELFEVLLSLETIKECEDFFADLCTIKEVEAMGQRWKAAKMIANKETYETIIEKTDISSATLSRISKCYQYGNGYRKMIKKMNRKSIALNEEKENE